MPPAAAASRFPRSTPTTGAAPGGTRVAYCPTTLFHPVPLRRRRLIRHNHPEPDGESISPPCTHSPVNRYVQNDTFSPLPLRNNDGTEGQYRRNNFPNRSNTTVRVRIFPHALAAATMAVAFFFNGQTSLYRLPRSMYHILVVRSCGKIERPLCRCIHVLTCRYDKR